MFVPDDVGKDLAELSNVRWIRRQQHLRSFSIAQNRPERLVEFMRAWYALGRVYAELPGFLGGGLYRAEACHRRGLAVDPNYTLVRLELARKERERLEGLFAQQAVPERRVAEARSAESLAREEATAATRRLAQYQGTQRASGEGATGKVELRSPVTGVVAAVSTAPGAFVEEGKPLFHVVDPDRLWLDVQVPEADIGRIGKPSGAWFEAQGFDRPFTVDAKAGGKVVAFGGVVDAQSRTTPLIFEVGNRSL